ncbi:MAG TPA: Spy/CpxP family protein refolding chaperone [Planctomycetota bacterium]|nr:Spy/CpxP family protein refolding chaperone [Planctomycetota bacterium]
MKTWVAVGVVLLSARAGFAQQQDDPVERSVQRLKDQLSLTDDQVTKIRDFVKKEREDVKSVLTDTQKATYDQAGGPRGNRGQGGATPGAGNTFAGFRGGAWLPPTNDLKTQLSLTDDQVTKINEIRDAVRQEMRTFFQNRGRGQGGQNLADQWNAFQEKSKEDSTKKILEILTDEQKPKFEEALKTFAANQPPPGAGFGQNRGTVDERVARVMDTLKIEDPKESEAVKGLVRKVVEAMDKLDGYQRESRTKIDEVSKDKDLSDKAVGEKIEAILKGSRDLEKDLAGARKALTEVVTNRQELELLRRGILR